MEDGTFLAHGGGVNAGEEGYGPFSSGSGSGGSGSDGGGESVNAGSTANPITAHRRRHRRLGRAVKVHHFAHRYAPGAGRKETVKASLTYHAAVLVEYDHGQYGTLIELAWWNGASG